MATAMVMALLLVIACWLWRLLHLWWRRRSMVRVFHKQGIEGPSGNLFRGGAMVEILKLRHLARQNDMESLSHDLLGRMNPDYVKFSKQYGVPYFVWWMGEPRIFINSPELVREFLSKKAAFTGKSSAQRSAIVRLLGHGLVAANGEEWLQHRRVVSPAFRRDKIETMAGIFSSCTLRMLDEWGRKVGESKAEIEVEREFSMLTADIISHTAFGSSYEKGRRVFEILCAIGALLPEAAFYEWIPFIRLIPMRLNRELWRLEKEQHSLLIQMVKERKDSVECGRTTSYGDDLLGMMIAESQTEQNKAAFDDLRLIGECKTFFLAGHETTASLLTWTMLMLSIYPEWQDRAREEVFEVCNDDIPTAEMLGKLKTVNMILNETLRLYPPATFIGRGCFTDMQVGDLFIPKGTSIEIPILAMHHNEKFWGPDVHEFKPERFASGISKASKHPNAFMAFSFGPRVCVGQLFALMEAKLVMAALLRRFSFSLSPIYRHSPTLRITLKPKHGMPIIFRSLQKDEAMLQS